MAKKVSKTFTKPKRVEVGVLAKSGLLDEVKEETSEDGCSMARSDLEMIFRRVIVKSIQDNSYECKGHSVWIRNGSWSRKQHMKEARGRMVMFWYRECISHGEKSMVWCTSRGGEKHIWCESFQVRNVVATWFLNQKNVVLDRHTELKGGD
ncbi:hypothetical protein F2Q68_00038733 [Brassica cretica]|uniref:Uncharacterized protein n=1 Tax=Brassica cretica TaxID=69181 RepID=A0A8S9MJS3_BRACR|nr:hypothetical protein F2Q68_00038733 [Brassica cretica]